MKIFLFSVVSLLPCLAFGQELQERNSTFQLSSILESSSWGKFKGGSFAIKGEFPLGEWKDKDEFFGGNFLLGGGLRGDSVEHTEDLILAKGSFSFLTLDFGYRFYIENVYLTPQIEIGGAFEGSIEIFSNSKRVGSASVEEFGYSSMGFNCGIVLSNWIVGAHYLYKEGSITLIDSDDLSVTQVDTSGENLGVVVGYIF